MVTFCAYPNGWRNNCLICYISIDLKVAYRYLPYVLAIQCTPLGTFKIFFGKLSVYVVYLLMFYKLMSFF